MPMAKIKRTNQQRGKLSRRKGRKFEQVTATAFRELLAGRPQVAVRRSLQAHKPYEPDIVIEGADVPPIIAALWLECNDATNPNPLAKLIQAERDSSAAIKAGKRTKFYAIPVVVWHKLGEHGIQATMRARALYYLVGVIHLGEAVRASDVLVTMDFQDFVKLLAATLAEFDET
jgi:hypothetical protein